MQANLGQMIVMLFWTLSVLVMAFSINMTLQLVLDIRRTFAKLKATQEKNNESSNDK